MVFKQLYSASSKKAGRFLSKMKRGGWSGEDFALERARRKEGMLVKLSVVTNDNRNQKDYSIQTILFLPTIPLCFAMLITTITCF